MLQCSSRHLCALAMHVAWAEVLLCPDRLLCLLVCTRLLAAFCHSGSSAAAVAAAAAAASVVNGKPTCANPELLKILRDDWGFEVRPTAAMGAVLLLRREPVRGCRCRATSPQTATRARASFRHTTTRRTQHTRRLTAWWVVPTSTPAARTRKKSLPASRCDTP